jgi:hypothetical protein
MPQIDSDFRHHLVNGLVGIRASEQALRSGYTYTTDSDGNHIKAHIDPKEYLDNIDQQLKRIFEALEKFEKS